MGYRPRNTTIEKRGEYCIKGCKNLTKFSDFPGVQGPLTRARDKICPRRRSFSNCNFVLTFEIGTAAVSEQMQGDSEDDRDDVVFLSPDESPTNKDQGASPRLRQSNKKRKSTSAVSTDMSKGSGTKKKKCSPPKESPPKNNPGKSMSRIPRTPLLGQS